MNYQELGIFGAVVIGLLVFALCASSAIGSWAGCDAAQKIVDGTMIFLIVAVCSGLAYTVIVLHNPARVAAFNPCDHPKPHKRPANCPK